MAMVPQNTGPQGYGGPQGFGPGGPGGPQMYGPPIKDKGPSLSTVMSDNMAVAMAKTFRTTHKDVDIAIIKATTSKFSVVPKEKHVRTLKRAVHGGQPGSYGGYVITKLMERLHAAKHWLCALKTLMVFHRLMRESEGASFVSELGKYGGHGYGGRGGALSMDNFVDNESGDGKYDYSEWVRVYARYLDEQLDVYVKTSFFQEAEGSPPAEGKMRNLPPTELLTQLPPLQQLLERLMCALPRGAASRHYVVQAALLTVAKESFQIYRTISEGIINLADCFFDMDVVDAQQGLDIYKQHTEDNDRLAAFYASAEQIEELKRSATFPKLTPPSPDFLGLMEEYVANVKEEGKAGSKGRNVKEEAAELPPPVEFVPPPQPEPEPEPEPEIEVEQPDSPPVPEMDLLNFDEPETNVPAPPPKELTATELLEAERAAGDAPTANGHSGAQAAAPPPSAFGPQSNNPFGEGSTFGQPPQQQQAQPQMQPNGSYATPGAVVPYGPQGAYGGGPGFGGQQQYGQPPYAQQGYAPYGQQGQGYGGGVQPGQMVPYGSQAGMPSPYGAMSPAGSFNQTPGGHTPGAAGAAQQTHTFRAAALTDPFAELGPIAPPPTQQTPPLREVSPTQQRINLGGYTQQPQMHQQQSGQWGQPHPQQWAQQPQQNGWNPQQVPQQNGYLQGPGGAPSPATPPMQWQK